MLRGVLAFALLASSGLAAQDRFVPRDNPSSQTGTSVIRGRVVAAATGEVLRKARVTLSSGPTLVFTDNEGRFAFTNLPRGRYTLSARKTGYAATTFGAARPGAPPISIEVANGASVEGIEVRMPRAAAISGRILDQFGDPLELAAVFAERLVHARGRIDTVMQAATATDDLGEYRLGGLPAGSYVVRAALPNSDFGSGLINASGVVTIRSASPEAGRAYYPGVGSIAAAQAIAVRAGEEASSIDFSASPVKLAKVSVAFVDAKGAPSRAVGAVSRADGAGSRIDTGTFGQQLVFTLEPGEWVLYARSDQGAVGISRFWVGSGDVSMSMTLTPGGRIRGRVVVEGAPLPTGATVLLEAASLDPSIKAPGAIGIGRMNADGAFEIGGLLGPRELRLNAAPPGWILKSAQVDGRDLLDQSMTFKGGEDLAGVQVVLTSRTSKLIGTAVDAAKAPVRNFSVLIFPEDESLQNRRRSLSRLVRPNQDGAFVADDLVAGAYLAIALEDADETQATSAEYLNQFRARATHVTLREGETQSIALPIGGGPGTPGKP